MKNYKFTTISVFLILTGCVISLPQNSNHLIIGTYTAKEKCVLDRNKVYVMPAVPDLSNVSDVEVIDGLVDHIAELRENIHLLTGDGC